jgi:hypothetical protein
MKLRDVDAGSTSAFEVALRHQTIESVNDRISRDAELEG